MATTAIGSAHHRRDFEIGPGAAIDCDRVHSALIQLVSGVVTNIVSIQAHLQRKASGHLPFAGLPLRAAEQAVEVAMQESALTPRSFVPAARA